MASLVDCCGSGVHVPGGGVDQAAFRVDGGRRPDRGARWSPSRDARAVLADRLGSREGMRLPEQPPFDASSAATLPRNVQHSYLALLPCPSSSDDTGTYNRFSKRTGDPVIRALGCVSTRVVQSTRPSAASTRTRWPRVAEVQRRAAALTRTDDDGGSDAVRRPRYARRCSRSSRRASRPRRPRRRRTRGRRRRSAAPAPTCASGSPNAHFSVSFGVVAAVRPAASALLEARVGQRRPPAVPTGTSARVEGRPERRSGPRADVPAAPAMARPARYSATARRSASASAAPCSRIRPVVSDSTIDSGVRWRSASTVGARGSPPVWHDAHAFSNTARHQAPAPRPPVPTPAVQPKHTSARVIRILPTKTRGRLSSREPASDEFTIPNS